jgi:hypothetical protein
MEKSITPFDLQRMFSNRHTDGKLNLIKRFSFICLLTVHLMDLITCPLITETQDQHKPDSNEDRHTATKKDSKIYTLVERKC